MSVQDALTPNKASYSLNEVEDMFLGAIIGGLVDQEELLKVKRDVLPSIDGRMIYDTLIHAIETGNPVDYLTAITEFGKHKGTNTAKTIINRMISAVPPSFEISSAIEVMEESFMRRNAIELLDFARIKIQETPHLAGELILNVYERLQSLTESKVEFDLNKEFSRTVEDILAGNTNKLIIPTGISTIDAAIGGYSTQEITVIGGRPGHGKTTSAVNLSLAALAKNPELKITMFQLEMSKEAVKRKFISAIGNVSSFKLRTGNITEKDKENVQYAAEQMKKFEGRLFMYDNVYDLYSMNKILRTNGSRLAFVDFVTLMDEAQAVDIRRELTKVAIKAKRFAKTHNMAYIFYSQLNRGPDQRDNHKPMAADLAESDGLSQLASEIILLYYRFKYNNDPIDKNKLFLIIDKARYAAVTDVKLFFDPDLIVLRDF
jgi:replicative DNA helicase